MKYGTNALEDGAQFGYTTGDVQRFSMSLQANATYMNNTFTFKQ